MSDLTSCPVAVSDVEDSVPGILGDDTTAASGSIPIFPLLSNSACPPSGLTDIASTNGLIIAPKGLQQSHLPSKDSAGSLAFSPNSNDLAAFNKAYRQPNSAPTKSSSS